MRAYRRRPARVRAGSVEQAGPSVSDGIERAAPPAPPPAAYEPYAQNLRPGLESCGLVATDSKTILLRLVAGEGIDRIAREIADGQILTKRTSHGRDHILRAIRRRYLEAPCYLPSVPDLARMLARLSSPAAQSQLLLPYLLMSDRAAYEVVESAILPRRRAGELLLPKQAIVNTLSAALVQHEQRLWSPGLRERWARGLCAALRDVGALERGPRREVLLPYSLRSEVFSFYLWSLYEAGLRGRGLVMSPLWRLLLLVDEAEVRVGLAGVVDRGWWRSATVASVEETTPTTRSLEEWRDGLG